MISVLIYRQEAWRLDSNLLRSINGFNSRCLARITGREIRDEATDATFDLCLYLRSQRLRYLGHVLRSDESSMVRKVILSRGTNHRAGDLFMDSPVHNSIEELVEIARDRDQWRIHAEEIAGQGRFETMKANTAAETAAEIDALPSDAILAYTDGGCDGNGANSIKGKAGWGAWISRKPDENGTLGTDTLPRNDTPNNEASITAPTSLADLWGPVVTDPSDPFYCECTSGTNNTGELTGIFNALLWAQRQGGEEPFAILYDSMYAANITRGVWKPKSNKGIANLCIDALKRENERRKGGIHFIHVKGHSNNAGNDKADDRVQWGKMD